MRILLLAAGGLAAAAAPAAGFHCASGPAGAALIELYTSEGCSSCPPAERWLGTLRGDPRLWREFVPVAFHVDYWDNLGWPDRFANRAFTRRQYALAAAWGADSVYTPCLVRNGRAWRPDGSLQPAPDESPGILDVRLGADGVCRVRFTPSQPRGRENWEAHVAVLGGGFVSRVTAGENSGATLRHEFVALALVDAPMRAGPDAATADLVLPPVDDTGAARLSLAAWVTRRGSLEPVQAAGGWLRGD